MSKDVAVAQPKSELAIIADKINSGLAAFENRKTDLISLKEEVENLKIESLEDRVGIRQVTEARKKLKAARVEIEKEGKSMRDPLTAINKNISSKEKELVDIIEPTEKSLKVKEDWVKAEEKRIEEESAAKEKARIQARIDRLAAYGFTIDIAFIEAIGDEDFEKVAENAKAEYEKEQISKAEQAEAERRQKEKDEKDRAELRVLREKQAEADRKLKEREDEIARKEEELERGRIADRREMINRRIYRLNNVSFDGQEVWWKHVNRLLFSGWDSILAPSEEEFNKYVIAHNTMNEKALHELYLAEEKKKKDNEEELQRQLDEARKESIEATLASMRLGMLMKLGLTYPNGDLGKISEEQWDKMYAHRKADYDDGQRALEQQRKEDEKMVEAERIAQASDKDKFAIIVSYLEDLPMPEVKSAKSKKLMGEVKDLQAKFIAHIKAKS